MQINEQLKSQISQKEQQNTELKTELMQRLKEITVFEGEVQKLNDQIFYNNLYKGPWIPSTFLSNNENQSKTTVETKDEDTQTEIEAKMNSDTNRRMQELEQREKNVNKYVEHIQVLE